MDNFFRSETPTLEVMSTNVPRVCVNLNLMVRRITPKQKKFADKYLELDNGTQAALAVYDTTDYNTAHAIAHENLQKPTIRNYLEEALPDDLLARVHKEGLEALTESGNEDYSTRHKYLDTAYKLKGSYAAEKNITLTVKAEDLQRTIAEDLLRFRGSTKP